MLDDLWMRAESEYPDCFETLAILADALEERGDDVRGLRWLIEARKLPRRFPGFYRWHHRWQDGPVEPDGVDGYLPMKAVVAGEPLSVGDTPRLGDSMMLAAELYVQQHVDEQEVLLDWLGAPPVGDGDSWLEWFTRQSESFPSAEDDDKPPRPR